MLEIKIKRHLERVCRKVLQNMFLDSDLSCHLRIGGNTLTFQCSVCGMMHFLDFWLINAFLSQNVVFAIYALFPQFFWDWKAESADFFTSRMYGITHPICFVCVYYLFQNNQSTWLFGIPLELKIEGETNLLFDSSWLLQAGGGQAAFTWIALGQCAVPTWSVWSVLCLF